MFKNLRKYYFLLVTQVKDAFAFRSEGLVYFMWDLSTPFLMMMVWKTILVQGKTVGGFDLDQMLLYYLFIFILRTVLSVYPWNISEEVRSGELNQRLTKPINFLYYQLLGELAWKMIRALFLIFAVSILSITILNGIEIPWTSFLKVEFLAAISVSFMMNYFLKTVIEMFSFWLSRVESFRVAFYILEDIFSGALIPLTILPSFFQSVGRFTPFNYFYSFPTKILLGKMSNEEMISGLVIGIAWLVAGYLVTNWLFKKGVKNYAAYSG